MSVTHIWCGVLCFHLNSAERGTAVESTDSLVMSVGHRGPRRVWLRRWLVTAGFGGCSGPARSAVRTARTPKRLESWKFLVLRATIRQNTNQLGTRGDAELPEYLPQVVVDAAGVDEQLRGDAAVALARADQPDNPRPGPAAARPTYWAEGRGRLLHARSSSFRARPGTPADNSASAASNLRPDSPAAASVPRPGPAAPRWPRSRLVPAPNPPTARARRRLLVGTGRGRGAVPGPAVRIQLGDHGGGERTVD